MKKTTLVPTLILAAALPLAASAATFTGDPVGYSTTTATDGADTLLGTPLYQATQLEDTISSIAAGVITATADLTGADYATEAHFALVTSGTDAGQFYTITANTATTITLDLNGATGPAAADTYKVVPYWTLDTLFPAGAGVGASANPYAPSSVVFTNDLGATGVNLATSASYMYIDQATSDSNFLSGAGWYDATNPFGGLVGGTALSPETYVVIRNLSGADNDVVVSGEVPTDVVGTPVGRIGASAQDNKLVNPYPAAMTLNQSGLAAQGVVDPSSNPYAPGDQVFVFGATTSTNPASSAAYMYIDQATSDSNFLSGAGWYDATNPFGGLVGDTVSIPAGAAFIVRKENGAAGTTNWNPPLPYSL